MPTRLSLVAYLAAFSGLADAFWRLPCRGRAGAARMDPLMDVGSPSYHVHAVHGSGGFSMSADQETLQATDCTSCGVTQDHSAYWHPALYFLHDNGTAEMAQEEGGMLAYYLLYGDNIKAFPQGFRMIAGDTFQRNFTWPIPDPPKSLWVGEQSSQRALRQKALGFNCLNYNKPSEPSLYRHYMPDKDYLDENCPDGLRFEVMFPSCWNGKDVDSPDHKSHMAYPSLVMDGECPEGFETRLVSLFYETIWNTHAFKGMAGKFVLANGDPTGFGYHGDFMQGWDAGVLQQAVDKCTNPSGEVTDCPVFDLQSQDKMEQCHFKMPDVLKNEDVYFNRGLPGGVKIESGPAYAFPIEYTTTAAVPTASPVQTSTTSSTSLSFDVGNILADGISTSSSTSTPTTTPSPTSAPTTTSISTPTPTPTPATSYIEGPVTRVIIQVQREIIVETDCEGNHITTVPGDLKTVGTSSTIVTETVSTAVTMETPSVPEADADAAHAHKRAHRHGHGHAHLHRRGNMV